MSAVRYNDRVGLRIKTMNYIKKIWNYIKKQIYRIKISIHDTRRGKGQRLCQNDLIEKESIIILGNGPSLNTSVEKYHKILLENELMCVNQFAETELFQDLKPTAYVLADGTYFCKDIHDTSLRIQKMIRKLVAIFNNDVSWPLRLFCPDYARESYLVRKLKKNKLIKIFYYSSFTIPKNIFCFKEKVDFLSKDLIMPPSMTVLNTCVAICIFCSIKKIYLIGADTSWHANCHVDQSTNKVLYQDSHFYGNESEAELQYEENEETSTMGKLLEEVSRSLNYYKFLDFYARERGVRVYNSSEYSWIDSFERKKLDELS